MTEAIAGIAAAVVAVIGVVMYVLKQGDSPRSQYKQAVAEYERAVQDEAAVLAQLRAELEKGVPDRELFRELSDRVHAAARRVRQCRETRDALRIANG